jgi:hypothetical protein
MRDKPRDTVPSRKAQRPIFVRRLFMASPTGLSRTALGGVYLDRITYQRAQPRSRVSQAADIKVILATIPPWETDPITVGNIAYDADPSVGRYALIDTRNAWLRQYASDNNIPLVDYHAALEASNAETT